MFYACVRRFDVTDTVGKFLRTKQSLRRLNLQLATCQVPDRLSGGFQAKKTKKNAQQASAYLMTFTVENEEISEGLVESCGC